MLDQGDTIFRGTPVVSGIARGRVKLVHGWEKDVAVDPETVLITRFPIPRISPMLKHASALLCAYGVGDCFLAIKARERGIPAVFSLGSAIEALPDAAWVSVDGVSGLVRRDGEYV